MEHVLKAQTVWILIYNKNRDNTVKVLIHAILWCNIHLVSCPWNHGTDVVLCSRFEKCSLQVTCSPRSLVVHSPLTAVYS